MIGFPIAVLTSNAFEWYAHKKYLHEHATRHRNSPYFSHIRHHKNVRINAFKDDNYHESMMDNAEVYFEKTTLLMLCGATTLVAPIAPFFTLGTYYSAWRYYALHSKAHLDPEWARKNLPWHYDHHMNSNQNANWCVTRPWFDYIMGTRVIGDPAHAETNPLGMQLPALIERPLNALARRLLPQAYLRLDTNKRREAANQHEGIAVPIEAA